MLCRRVVIISCGCRHERASAEHCVPPLTQSLPSTSCFSSSIRPELNPVLHVLRHRALVQSLQKNLQFFRHRAAWWPSSCRSCPGSLLICLWYGRFSKTWCLVTAMNCSQSCFRRRRWMGNLMGGPVLIMTSVSARN